MILPLICFHIFFSPFQFGNLNPKSLNNVFYLTILIPNTLRYPIEVADLWIFKEKLYETNINYNPFKKATARLAASHHGVAATSTLAFALICIIRFFQVFGTSPSTRRSFSSSALPRREQFHVNNKWKIALTLMLAGISLLVGIVNYKYAEEEWFHAFQAPLVLFFPLFVMASTLFSAFLKTEFSTSARAASQGENTGRLLAIYCTFLSYLLLWTPSFAVDMLHGYCCTFDWVTKERVTVVLDNLLHFKTCLNAVFLYTCDAQFRSVFEATARQFGTSLCCFFDSPIGGKNIGFEHTVNDSDISVRYTVNDEDMMIDMEQQALVA